jgi:RNA polymerase sigma factor (sigma-70 family)
LSSLSSNPLEAIEQRAVAEKQAANEVGELRYQWEEKLAEVRKQAEEEEKKLIEKQEKSIEKVTDKLFDTLITKPKEFGKDLAKTIREELMKPITEGMSHMSANILQPAIYGEDGTGGLAGIFKGIFGGGKGSDPVKVSTDQNTVATVQNSAHVAALGAYARRRIRGEVLDGLRRDDHISRHARAKARAEGADADAGPVPLVYPDALVGDVLAPDEYAVEKECEELIQEALGFLPARERLVMLAYYFSGKFMREIGADLDVPMAAPENPVALPARKLGRA